MINDFIYFTLPLFFSPPPSSSLLLLPPPPNLARLFFSLFLLPMVNGSGRSSISHLEIESRCHNKLVVGNVVSFFIAALAYGHPCAKVFHSHDVGLGLHETDPPHKARHRSVADPHQVGKLKLRDPFLSTVPMLICFIQQNRRTYKNCKLFRY